MNIRPALPADMYRGFLETLTSLSDTNLSSEQAAKILQHRHQAGIRTYVAMIDGQVVGTGSLLVEQKFIHAGGLVGHVEDVAVHPDHGGGGIGLNITRHLVAEARRLGCYKVILDCKPELIPFYQRAGFRQWVSSMRIDLHQAASEAPQNGNGSAHSAIPATVAGGNGSA